MSNATKNDATPINATPTKTPKNEQKTFTLAQLARDCQLNEKIVRARFRRYFHDENTRFDVVRKTLKNAKSRWVYSIEHIDAIRDIVKRDDD